MRSEISPAGDCGSGDGIAKTASGAAAMSAMMVVVSFMVIVRDVLPLVEIRLKLRSVELMWCLSMQEVDFDLVGHRLAIYLRTRMDLVASMTSDSTLSHQCDNTFTLICNWQGLDDLIK